jgi:hypothetical protein
MAIQRQEVMSMHRVCAALAAWAFVMTPFLSSVAASRQAPPVERTFEHYERIRSALAQDTTKNIATEARALSPLARDIAGEQAVRTSASLAEAKTLEDAREQFGAPSEALVPKFLEAGLPGVQGFVCSMKDKRWVQRGEKPANPYFGKSMSTCGTAIKPGDKS